MLLGSEGEKAFCRNTRSPRDGGGRGQRKMAACTYTFGTAGRQGSSPGKLALWFQKHSNQGTL